MFIYFERERDSITWGGAQREGERERERIPSRLHAVSAEPHAGLELTNCEIATRAEAKSRMLNQPSHPGALRVCAFFFFQRFFIFGTERDRA